MPGSCRASLILLQNMACHMFLIYLPWNSPVSLSHGRTSFPVQLSALSVSLAILEKITTELQEQLTAVRILSLFQEASVSSLKYESQSHISQRVKWKWFLLVMIYGRISTAVGNKLYSPLPSPRWYHSHTLNVYIIGKLIEESGLINVTLLYSSIHFYRSDGMSVDSKLHGIHQNDKAHAR